MVETLGKATFLTEIDKILDNVPRGLGQLYGRIFEKLLGETESRQKAAHALLKWLTCSERHLTLKELAVALAVREGAMELDPDDRVLDLVGFLEDVCGSLIRISEASDNRTESVVSFVHLTVKEFLLSSDELWGTTPTKIAKFRVHKTQANQNLASICITYLSFDVFKNAPNGQEHWNPQTLLSSDFLDYSAFYWVRHLAQSGQPTVDLLRRLHLFLTSDKLLAYLERNVSANTAAFSVSNLLVSQNLLNAWIEECNAEDPRLAMVVDCFRKRLEETVQGRSDSLGPDHIDTLEAIFQLAQLLHFRGEWHRSAALHRQALDGRFRSLGENDPGTLESMHQLASVLTRLGKHDESRLLHERCLQGRRKPLGPKHVDTLLFEDSFSKTLKELGLLDEAETMSRSTLMRKNRAFGDNSLESVKTMDNLAAILKDVGLRWNNNGNGIMAKQVFWECEALSRKCLAVREAQLGEDNPQTLTCVNMLGLVLRHLQRPEESEQFHYRALQARLKIFGPYNPHTQRSMRNLSAVLRDQGKNAEADQIEMRYRESLEVDGTLKERESSTKS